MMTRTGISIFTLTPSLFLVADTSLAPPRLSWGGPRMDVVKFLVKLSIKIL